MVSHSKEGLSLRSMKLLQSGSMGYIQVFLRAIPDIWYVEDIFWAYYVEYRCEMTRELHRDVK